MLSRIQFLLFGDRGIQQCQEPVRLGVELTFSSLLAMIVVIRGNTT